MIYNLYPSYIYKTVYELHFFNQVIYKRIYLYMILNIIYLSDVLFILIVVVIFYTPNNFKVFRVKYSIINIYIKKDFYDLKV